MSTKMKWKIQILKGGYQYIFSFETFHPGFIIRMTMDQQTPSSTRSVKVCSDQ